MGRIKLILLILLFPLASFASEDYTEGVSKVMQILFENSQEKKDIDEGMRHAKDHTPASVVHILEIVLPTVNALRENKLELRYVKSF